MVFMIGESHSRQAMWGFQIHLDHSIAASWLTVVIGRIMSFVFVGSKWTLCLLALLEEQSGNMMSMINMSRLNFNKCMISWFMLLPASGQRILPFPSAIMEGLFEGFMLLHIIWKKSLHVLRHIQEQK